MKITVFTPTYNRGVLLYNLYNSLLTQTCKDFEWLIVDDGSNDNTKQIVNSFVCENKIRIFYLFKNNGGKHSAINLGILNAKGNLFFIVDSDDFLSSNAVERIIWHYAFVEQRNDYSGICGLKVFQNGSIIGDRHPNDIIECSLFHFRYKLKIKGDRAEIYKTQVLKEFLFPIFENEKFCAESLLWNRIALKYPNMRFFSEPIYICEYLDGGLSDNSIVNRQKSSSYTLLLNEELSKCNIPFQYKIRAVINFWRFSFYHNSSFLNKFYRVNIIYSLIAYPIGFVMYLIDKFRYFKSLNSFFYFL